MKLGMQVHVGLVPGYIVLGGDPARPPTMGDSPPMPAWIKMSLGMELGLGPCRGLAPCTWLC